MHYSVCLTVNALKCMHYSESITVNALQCMHYSVCITVYALQCMHYSVCITVYALQLYICGSDTLVVGMWFQPSESLKSRTLPIFSNILNVCNPNMNCFCNLGIIIYFINIFRLFLSSQ